MEPESQELAAQLSKRDELLSKAATPEEKRKIFSARQFNTAPEFQDVASVRELQIESADSQIGCRLYHPSPGDLHHCLVWFHGGGHHSGDLDSHDHLCRIIAIETGCAVLNVDYRLAPDHPFPAAYNDAVAAVRWVGREGNSFDLRTDSVLVGGSSAGGNLAAAAAIGMRDERGVHIIHQCLISPVLDATMSSDTYQIYATGFSLTTAQRRQSRDWYCGDFDDLRDPRLSPLFVADCAGLPAATILAAELDPVRGESERYAVRLIEAGVPVTYVCYAGTMHGFFSQSGALKRGADAVSQAIASIRFAISAYTAREPHRIQIR